MVLLFWSCGSVVGVCWFQPEALSTPRWTNVAGFPSSSVLGILHHRKLSWSLQSGGVYNRLYQGFSAGPWNPHFIVIFLSKSLDFF